MIGERNFEKKIKQVKINSEEKIKHNQTKKNNQKEKMTLEILKKSK